MCTGHLRRQVLPAGFGCAARLRATSCHHARPQRRHAQGRRCRSRWHQLGGACAETMSVAVSVAPPMPRSVPPSQPCNTAVLWSPLRTNAACTRDFSPQESHHSTRQFTATAVHVMTVSPRPTKSAHLSSRHTPPPTLPIRRSLPRPKQPRAEARTLQRPWSPCIRRLSVA